jgi:hypothetical protein
MHKIKISQKKDSENDIMVGANTSVTIDGVEVKGIQHLHFEITAGGIAELTLKMVGDIEIEGQLGQYEIVNPV